MATAFQNQFEHWRLRAQASPAGQFFGWWTAELRKLLPDTWQEQMEHARRRISMRVADHELEVYWHEGEVAQQLEVFSLDQDIPVQRQQILDLLQDRELDEAPRELVLSEDLVLRKLVFLPAAAESNLRQALAFEMDRHTPFRASDVYFDYRILHRDKDKGQLKLELVVAPKGPVDGQIELVSPRGLAPTGVDVALDGEPAGLNLLPLERRQRITNRRTRINLLLALAAFILLVAVMVQSLWLREQQIERLELAIDDVRVEARRVQNIRTQIEDASDAAGFMLKRRAETKPTLKVLAEVTKILPDDTYLDRLRVWDGNVQMQGKSANAQQLIEIVNLSPLFNNAGFRGSTRLDGNTQKEIFDLSAELPKGADEG
jgi:general secretion pathway protein L